MKPTGAILIAAAVALLAVATAAAVPVRGSLEVPRDFTPPEATGAAAGFYWEEWNGVLEPRPRRLDVPRELAVVLLGATDADRPGSTVKLQGGALMPSTMVVQAGTTLRIQNTDGCAHELHAEGIEGFSPLQTAPGNARSIELPSQVGHHVIRDRLYPHVEGHLHLVPNLVARATVADDGKYVFDDVPEGEYTLEVYYDDRKVHSQEIQVSGQLAVDPVRLDLSAASQ
jgi:plastocyanin